MKTTKTDETTPDIDSAFLSLLQQHRGGEVLSDLAAAMREVTEAVQLAGKPGAIILTIAIQPATSSGAVIVADEIKVKLPKEEKITSIFFSDDAGNLLRNDPRQKELPLRTVKGGVVEEEPLRRAAEMS